MRFVILAAVAVLLAACEPVPVQQVPPTEPASEVAASAPEIEARARRAARMFADVVETMEPVVEAECRDRLPRANCDFLIVVDDRPGQPPNAYQTEDRSGRPILAFNIALIASVRNADEMAFVMGHEAAHHILQHLDQTRQNATVGAVILSGLAALGGADAAGVESAEQLGAIVGARTYSKEFELEADELGTIVTIRAGYDAVRGSAFFNRLPDPGDKFLGSHPPNAARVQIVRDTAAKQ